MQVDFVALADFASVDAGGKMTIVGIFDRINTVSGNAQLALLAIAVRLRADDRDVPGKAAKVQVRMKAPDNSVLLQLDAEFTPGFLPPVGQREAVTMSVPFMGQNIVFPRPGKYTVEIWLDKIRAGETQLVVGPPVQPPQH